VAPEPLVACAEKSPGVVIVGAVLSGGGGGGVTTTSNDAEVELVWASVAVQVTVVVPTGKSEPEAGSQPEVTRSPSGSLKITWESKSTVIPSPLVACFVIVPGTVIWGGDPSKSLPALSVIADASGVAHKSTNAQTATSHLTLILGDPLLKAL
jgi:hypothetical protein